MQSKIEHTPGPWSVVNAGDCQGLVASDATGKNVAVTYDKRDARLIAAAPELLAALESVETGVFGSMLPNSDIATCTRGALLKVRAAIAKARG